jgi:hypothetical protein
MAAKLERAKPSPTSTGALDLFFLVFEDPDYFYANSALCVRPSKPLFWLAFSIQQIINSLIVLGTVSLCMSTVDDYNPAKVATSVREGNENWANFWEVFEVICVAAFTVDFVVRLGGSLYRSQFSTFSSQFLNWVDVVAIAPFYLDMVLGEMMDLRFVRVIRLVRIIRALRSPKFLRMAAVITEILVQAGPALMIPIFFMTLAMVTLSCMMYYIERGIHVYECMDGALHTGLLYRDGNFRKCKNHDPHWHHEWRHTEHYDGTVVAHHLEGSTIGSGYVYTSIPAALWWNVVTFTTVGYGDMFPTTTLGRWLNAFAIMLGIFFLAMPISIVGGSFVDAWSGLQYRTAVEKSRALQIENKQWKLTDEQLALNKRKVFNALDRLVAHVNQCQIAVPSGGQWDSRREELRDLSAQFEELFTFYSED